MNYLDLMQDVLMQLACFAALGLSAAVVVVFLVVALDAGWNWSLDVWERFL